MFLSQIWPPTLNGWNPAAKVDHLLRKPFPIITIVFFFIFLFIFFVWQPGTDIEAKGST